MFGFFITPVGLSSSIVFAFQYMLIHLHVWLVRSTLMLEELFNLKHCAENLGIEVIYPPQANVKHS